MKKTSRSGIFWGVSLIIIALLLIVDAVGTKMGFLDIGGLPVLRIIIGGLCVSWAIYAGVHGNLWAIFFPLGLVLLLFEDEIARLFNNPSGTDLYSVWLVLGVALLLSIGTYTLGFHREKEELEKKDKLGKNNLSAVVKYIDCTDFGTKDVGNNLGSMAVYFENTEKYEGGGVLCVGNNLGNATVYIPENWCAELKVDHNLGACYNFGKSGGYERSVVIRVKSNLGKFSVVRVGEEARAEEDHDSDDGE